jgi:hypothetical protein
MRETIGGGQDTLKRTFALLSTVFSVGIILYILLWSMNIVNFSGDFSDRQSEEMFETDCNGYSFQIPSNSVDYVSGFLEFTIVNSGTRMIETIIVNSSVETVPIDMQLNSSRMQELVVEIESNESFAFDVWIDGCKEDAQTIRG